MTPEFNAKAAEIMAEFPFAIGDKVIHAGAEHHMIENNATVRIPYSKDPNVGVVTGLWLEMCHGGFQQHMNVSFLLDGSVSRMRPEQLRHFVAPAIESERNTRND